MKEFNAMVNRGGKITIEGIEVDFQYEYDLTKKTPPSKVTITANIAVEGSNVHIRREYQANGSYTSMGMGTGMPSVPSGVITISKVFNDKVKEEALKCFTDYKIE